MKHYYYKFILAIIMMVCPVIASADEDPFEVDGFYYNKLSSNTVELNRAPSYWSDVSATIPSEVTYEGVTYKVTSIGNNAFYNSIGLVSVTLPNSITSIGEYAFGFCSMLKEITMGDNISSIGKGAFECCTRLKSITIPKSLKIIEERTFDGCESLSSIVIPDNVICIKEFAFCECYGLSSLTLSKNLESIEQYAFYACNKLETLEIPNGVKKIGHQSFSCLYHLKTLTIPSSLSTMEGSPFTYDYVLTSIKVDEGNEYYDSRDNCNALIQKDGDVLIQGCVNTIIPKSVKEIASLAFYACPIVSLNIPEGVKVINGAAFALCGNLVSVTIPSSVTSIIGGAFQECSNLSSITVDAGNKYYDSRNNCNAIIKTEGDTLVNGCYTTKIPEGVKAIGEFAFYGHKKFSFHTIPNSVEYIGSYAFAFNYDFTSIESLGGVKTIGDHAFYYCESLKNVTLPNGLTSIGNSAFEECRSLTSIDIPNSVTTIGEYAFSDCKELTSVSLSENLKTVNRKLFAYCSSLEAIDIPKGVTSIGSAAFIECRIVKNIKLPENLVTIGDSAFYEVGSSVYYLDAMTVNFPSTLKSIGDQAFYRCNVNPVIIPGSVDKIGRLAFTYRDLFVNLAEEPQEMIVGSGSFACDFYPMDMHVYEGLKDVYKNSVWGKWVTIIDDIPRNGVTPVLADGSTIESNNLSKLTTFQLIAIGDVAVNQNMKAKIYADNELIGEADFNDVTLADNIMTINFRSLANHGYDSNGMVKAKVVIEEGSVNFNKEANSKALTYTYETPRSIYDSFSTGINTVTQNPISTPRTTKRMVNGRLVIEKNEKQYSLDGMAL